MFRRDEAATFAAELAVSAAYAAWLQSLNRSYEPDWTWATVMGGVIISTTPAIRLARVLPGDWRDYERRVIAGFCTSGLIIIGWQLWQMAVRLGREQGYVLARRLTPEEEPDADTAPPLEPSA